MRLEPLYRAVFRYPEPRRQVVVTGTHLSDDERYRWLNDTVCAVVGEVEPLAYGGTQVGLAVAELIWEPPRG